MKYIINKVWVKFIEILDNHKIELTFFNHRIILNADFRFDETDKLNQMLIMDIGLNYQTRAIWSLTVSLTMSVTGDLSR